MAPLRVAAIVVFGLTLSLTVACDEKEPHDAPAGTCDASLIPIYTKAGCGKEVRPECLGGAGACASTVCSCDGRVIGSCNGYAREKYQFVFDASKADAGACKPMEGL